MAIFLLVIGSWLTTGPSVYSFKSAVFSLWLPLISLTVLLGAARSPLADSETEVKWARRLAGVSLLWLLSNAFNYIPLGSPKTIPGKFIHQQNDLIGKQGTLRTLNTLETSQGEITTSTSTPAGIKLYDPVQVVISPRLYGPQVISIQALPSKP